MPLNQIGHLIFGMTNIKVRTNYLDKLIVWSKWHYIMVKSLESLKILTTHRIIKFSTCMEKSKVYVGVWIKHSSMSKMIDDLLQYNS